MFAGAELESQIAKVALLDFNSCCCQIGPLMATKDLVEQLIQREAVH